MRSKNNQDFNSSLSFESIEQYGEYEPITPRFVEFLEARMSARSLDLEGDVEKRPDYLCAAGAIVVEIKSLEGNPNARLINVIDDAKKISEWPIFYGKWPIESVLKNMPTSEAEVIKGKLKVRLARAIINHLKKANEQISSYVSNYRGAKLRLLVLINEGFAEYEPSIVAKIIQNELRRKNELGLFKYRCIDCVLFLSERHSTNIIGVPALPIVILHGPYISRKPTALKLLDRLVDRWVKWSSEKRKVANDDVQRNSSVNRQASDRMRRSELWELEYKRNPYMKKWKDEDVIRLWDSTLLMSMVALSSDSPVKISSEQLIQVLKRTTHLFAEFAARGIAINKLTFNKERLDAALSKVDIEENVKKWLREKTSTEE